MNPEQIKLKLNTEADFICLKRFDFSIDSLLVRYPEGCPDRIIAQALAITEEELPKIYDEVVTKLRDIMGVIPDSL